MTRSTVRSGVVALTLVAVVAAGGCGGEKAAVEERGRVPVAVAQVGAGTVSPVMSYSGTVKPWRKVLLGAQIPGRVEKLHVDVGDRVTEGDLLVELGGEQLTEARARFAAIESDHERMKVLADRGAISEQAFEQSEAAYKAAKAGYDLVTGSARLRAPFSGIVSARYLDEGEVFTLMSMMTPSPAVLEIVKIDTVKVEIRVAEREKALVSSGLAAEVTSSALRGRTLRGEVTRVDPILDAMSRTAAADVVVANPGEVLRPGMFADVALALSPRSALLVPRDALVRQEGTAAFYVYVVDGGVARRRDLRLGESFGESVEVLAGLEDGESVVTAGRYRLRDGAEVEIVEAPAAASAGEEEAGR
ncbi:MAG: efflux RND transporter periplasmic adaptor subunit [Candidatus Eisenbacteria bacterium]|nr:efflux RND transporter periplasmic adaptor subunit [Candidatus Eisenbacteria bacterium]